jgi:hypothetical protein
MTLVTCKHCNGTRETMGRKPGTTVHRSIVKDVPGHPVSAMCALRYCQDFVLLDTLRTLRTALLDLHIDGANVWEHWLDDDGTLHHQVDALLGELPLR